MSITVNDGLFTYWCDDCGICSKEYEIEELAEMELEQMGWELEDGHKCDMCAGE